jgi:capsular exopolysaccharide synthesis family protein
MASLIVVFGLSFFKRTVSSPEEAEQELDVANLGVVEPAKRNKLQPGVNKGLTGDANLTESFTVLSLNLETALARSGARSLLLTSPDAGDTTAATLVNLGKSLAQLGKSVILVDANLREPLSHHFFGLASTQGLTTALTRPEDEMLEALVPTEFENFRLLPRGPLPSNPAKLLNSAEMEILIERLKIEADVVLFNTPNVVAAADSLLLARLCDATLLVVQGGKAKPGSLRKAATLFAQAGLMLRGFLWLTPGVKFEKKFSGQTASRSTEFSPLVPPSKVEKVEAAADSSVESAVAEPAEEREVGS